MSCAPSTYTASGLSYFPVKLRGNVLVTEERVAVRPQDVIRLLGRSLRGVCGRTPEADVVCVLLKKKESTFLHPGIL